MDFHANGGVVMRRTILIAAGAGILAWAAVSSTGAAYAQQMSAAQCPGGFKLIGKVCLSADQQTAQCLYPAATGQSPKRGTTSEVNPASCPRHPPGSMGH
jgi:hypothetical protein